MLMPVGGLSAADLRDVFVVSGVILALLGTHWFMRNKEFGSAMKQLPWPAIAAILAAMLIAIVLSPGEERDFIYFEF
jgi:predicted benzoate:H+ symporter BenE